MFVNHVAENVLGTIGTVLWCIQIIPQIVVNFRRKDVVGLSPWLMFIWSSASIFLGAYAIIQDINIPIILQPQLFGFLAAVCWIQCLYYGPPHLSKVKAFGLGTIYLVLFAGIEVGLVYGGRRAEDNGSNGATLAFGIISAAMLMGALLPQYYEIFKFKEVIGLSLVFMTLDMLGGVFCTLSLIFKEEFDIVAGVNYIGIVILDGIILILAAILNPRANRRRKAEKALEAETPVQESTVSAAEEGRALSNIPTSHEGQALPRLHHHDAGAISGVTRDGEPDLATIHGVVGKNEVEQKQEKELAKGKH